MRQKQNLIEGFDASIVNGAALLLYYGQEYVKELVKELGINKLNNVAAASQCQGEGEGPERAARAEEGEGGGGEEGGRDR